jgi:hypothetical protein
VPIDPDALPNDPIVLQEMLRELYAENDKLRLMIQRLTRHQFGRRSEQLTVEQLQLGLEDREQTVAENRLMAASKVPGPIAVLPVIMAHCRRICRATRW